MAKTTDKIASIDKKIMREQEKSDARILKIIKHESDTATAIQLVDAEKKATAHKIDQWKHEKEGLVGKAKNQAKANRTSRLIQNGLLVEQYLNCKGAPPAVVKWRLEDVVQARGNFPPVTEEETARAIEKEKTEGNFPPVTTEKNAAEVAATKE